MSTTKTNNRQNKALKSYRGRRNSIKLAEFKSQLDQHYIHASLVESATPNTYVIRAMANPTKVDGRIYTAKEVMSSKVVKSLIDKLWPMQCWMKVIRKIEFVGKRAGEDFERYHSDEIYLHIPYNLFPYAYKTRTFTINKEGEVWDGHVHHTHTANDEHSPEGANTKLIVYSDQIDKIHTAEELLQTIGVKGEILNFRSSFEGVPTPDVRRYIIYLRYKNGR